MAKLRWIILTLLAVGCATPALALEWQRVASWGELIDGGPFGAQISFPFWVTGDGAVVIRTQAQGVGVQIHGLARWTPEGGLGELASFEDVSLPEESPVVTVGGPSSGILEPRPSEGAWLTVDRRASIIDCGFQLSTPLELSVALDASGSMHPIAMPGDAAPGFDPGWIFAADRLPQHESFGDESPAVNGSGEVAFVTPVRFGDPCGLNPLTPWAVALFGPDGGGGLTRIAVDRQPLPEVAASASLELSQRVRISLDDAGRVAFFTGVRVGGSGPVLGALFRWDGAAGLRMVARAGGPSPLGGVFGYVRDIDFGSGGRLAFVDSGEQKTLLVSHPAGTLEAHHRTGDHLPGIPADWILRDFDDYDEFVDYFIRISYVNGEGDVAISAEVGADDELAPTSTGIWAPNASGETALRLLEGAPAPGIPGKVVRELGLLAMNDARDVLLWALVGDPGDEPFAWASVVYLSRASGAVDLVTELRSYYEIAFDTQLTRVAALRPADSTAELYTAQLPEPGSLLAPGLALGVLAILATRRRCALLVLLMAIATSNSARSLDWTQVAASGDPLLGAPAGTEIAYVSSLAWWSDGTLAFVASSESSSSLERWNTDGVIDLLAVFETRPELGGAPPLAFDEFESDRRWMLDRDVLRDEILVRVAACPDVGPASRAFFELRGVSAALDLVAQPGEPAPGLPGWTLRTIESLVTQPDGKRAFIAEAAASDPHCAATLDTPFVRTLFATDASGTERAVVGEGAEAPGYPGAPMRPEAIVSYSEAGEVVFQAGVRLGPSGPTISVLYRWSAEGGIRKIAGSFAVVPGLGSLGAIGSERGCPGGAVFRSDDRLLRSAPGGEIELLYEGPYAPFEVNDRCEAAFMVGDGPGRELWVANAAGEHAPRPSPADPPMYGTIVDFTSRGDVIVSGQSSSVWLSRSDGSHELLLGPGAALPWQADYVSEATVDASGERVAALLSRNAGGGEYESAIFVTTLPEPVACSSGVVALAALLALRLPRRRTS